jgi:hypothetical protein
MDMYAAFCGTGKTYLSNNFPSDYMEIECWEYRQGNFPENYIEDAIDLIGMSKYLFISTDPIILNELNNRGVKIKLYYPQNELRYEYLDRFLARDSPPDFIGAIMKYWNVWLDELKEQSYCEHIILQTNEYLQDVLTNKNRDETNKV